MSTAPLPTPPNNNNTVYYHIHGQSAVDRLLPILNNLTTPSQKFIDLSSSLLSPPKSPSEPASTHLIWSNSRRKDATNHLPNSSILDSKWTLALLSQTTLLLGGQTVDTNMFSSKNELLEYLSEGVEGLYVLKDAASNGAGGVWVLSPQTVSKFLSPTQTPLTNFSPTSTPKYVIQKYSLPPMLTLNRKTHVRLYALLACIGTNVVPYISRNAFLHLSNKEFTEGEEEDDEVHISNCCANSGNGERFAGEVCVDLEARSNDPNDYNFYKTYGLIRQTIRTTLLPFTTFTQPSSTPPHPQFSYLGIDIIICRTQLETRIDVLEINAPPSLDTATGLQAAETTHTTNVSGIIEEIVLNRPPDSPNDREKENNPPTTLSRSESIMRMKYNLLERRFLKTPSKSPQQIQSWCRTQFPYFLEQGHLKFFENAGGAQVPSHVVSAVTASLSSRWRDNVGSTQKSQAKIAASHLLGFSGEEFEVDFSFNSTLIFRDLARNLVGKLKAGDEVCVCSSNHNANLEPWIEEATKIHGLKIIKWDLTHNTPHHPNGWQPTPNTSPTSTLLPPITSNTKLLILPHSSNVFGVLAPLQTLLPQVRSISPTIKVVTDGVAAAPHRYVGSCGGDMCDYYVVSCHKLFGPHLGVCFSKKSNEYLPNTSGTSNFEASNGLTGLLKYFLELGALTLPRNPKTPTPSQLLTSILSPSGLPVSQTKPHLLSAYTSIELAESQPSSYLLDLLRFKWSSTTLISHYDDDISFSHRHRIPLITFYHSKIPSDVIVNHCIKNNVVVRNGMFLSDTALECWCVNRGVDFKGFKNNGGAVRVSLAHYNTSEELQGLCEVLESIEGWCD
ncbi:hypothetical protein TL16_g06058 [Triparma laevis f. inornata]|uniref:Aminotransferase class V domain-containing protein n=1 Tax=Triparma laevis f. inornata TaxID=1714386 RepID=A0A9W7ECG1_9STRA|nr:hypothetical protein TL16_g06058 [Triparma laevis f. inornata]